MRRKSSTLLILFLIESSLLFGQAFKAGLIGGISTSQVDGDTYAGYNKIGLLGGVFVSKTFSSKNKWSASMELTYIQKGSRKIPHPIKLDFTEYYLKLNYVEVPLVVKYILGEDRRINNGDSLLGDKRKIELEGGIAIGTLVRSEERDAFGLLPQGTSFQKMDYSIVFGINYSIIKNVFINIRTEYSILPVRKGAIGSYYQNWTYKILSPGYYNNLVIFSLRYMF